MPTLTVMSLSNAYLVERDVSLDLLLPVPEGDASDSGSDEYDDQTDDWLRRTARLIAERSGVDVSDPANGAPNKVLNRYHYIAIEHRYPGITCGCDKYGASMGRRNEGIEAEDGTVRVFYLPLWDGGYDPGGAYWGVGQDLYVATNGGDFFRTCRAANRAEAIEAMKLNPAWLMFPNGNR